MAELKPPKDDHPIWADEQEIRSRFDKDQSAASIARELGYNPEIVRRFYKTVIVPSKEEPSAHSPETASSKAPTKVATKTPAKPKLAPDDTSNEDLIRCRVIFKGKDREDVFKKSKAFFGPLGIQCLDQSSYETEGFTVRTSYRNQTSGGVTGKWSVYSKRVPARRSYGGW